MQPGHIAAVLEDRYSRQRAACVPKLRLFRSGVRVGLLDGRVASISFRRAASIRLWLPRAAADARSTGSFLHG